MVPVYAYGPGSEKFSGIYNNTDIFNKILSSFGFGKLK
jgi:alkaline phosphatase